MSVAWSHPESGDEQCLHLKVLAVAPRCCVCCESMQVYLTSVSGACFVFCLHLGPCVSLCLGLHGDQGEMMLVVAGLHCGASVGYVCVYLCVCVCMSVCTIVSG